MKTLRSYLFLSSFQPNLVTSLSLSLSPSLSLSGDFQLNLDRSAFVDWQRLRVQENADEIPPGKYRRERTHSLIHMQTCGQTDR
jgi:DNA replicative helicase MCM subunit Mcm2 (Cdc46/Mcm family)